MHAYPHENDFKKPSTRQPATGLMKAILLIFCTYQLKFMLQVSLTTSTQSSVLWGNDDVSLAERLKVCMYVCSYIWICKLSISCYAIQEIHTYMHVITICIHKIAHHCIISVYILFICTCVHNYVGTYKTMYIYRYIHNRYMHSLPINSSYKLYTYMFVVYVCTLQ